MLTQPPLIVMQHIRPQLSLNRMGGQRGDTAWIDAQRRSARAHFLLLADLKLAIVSNEERTETALRRFRAGELADAGIETANALFLGVAADGAPTFAAVLSAADMARLSGAVEQLSTLVDLRSL